MLRLLSRFFAVLVLLMTLPRSLVGAQEVTTDLPSEGYVDRNRQIEIRLPEPLADSRVAVFIGYLDVTELFTRDASGLYYRPSALRLPAGESELIVYQIDPDGGWTEIARAALRVRNALGLDRGSLDPRLDLGLEGRLARGSDPPEAALDRDTYQDLTGQFDFSTELERGAFAWSNRATLIGVDRRENALRFGELSDAAPLIDLSNYLVAVRSGTADASLGHVTLGRQRHLISGFSSRGARFGMALGPRVDFSAGVANASSVVGWSNPFGLEDPDHRIVTGTMGVDALSRPGGLRLEVSGMSGSRLPFAGFNQGVVNDAEEGSGFALRLEASDPSGRVRVEGGFARSRFDNPSDPTLAQGEDLVEVVETTNNARYLETSFDILRGVRLSESRTIDLTVAYRHERVDPLYRSLTAFAQSDFLTNEWTANASIAGIALQGSVGRAEDNLDDLPSVLKSLTRRTGLGASLPLPQLLRSESPWLPMLAWTFDRTRQFGASLPENGGFSDSHVPDQVSRSHVVSADWQLGTVVLGYRLNHSAQDNRQPGRENADFSNLVNTVSLGLSPLSRLSVDMSVDFERAENHEVKEIERTRRYAVSSSWQPFEQSTLAASISFTRSTDDADLRERRDTLFDVQWSAVVPGLRSVEGRYYLRFGRTVQRARDDVFDLDDRNAQWSVNSGLNMSLF